MIRVCRRYGAVFSLAPTRNAAVQRVIDSLPEATSTPTKYRGAVRDPETGAWISDAEVAETAYTTTKYGTYPAVTARLIVRRAKDANQPQDGLFPIWRYHPFFTNTTETATAADITHRRHAIIETTFADLIDGAHSPPGRFGANSARADNQIVLREMLRATLDSERDYRRPRHRRDLIDEALEPLRDELAPDTYRRLTANLSLYFGIDPIVVLETFTELGREEGIEALVWGATTLARAQLDETTTPRTDRDHSNRR